MWRAHHVRPGGIQNLSRRGRRSGACGDDGDLCEILLYQALAGGIWGVPIARARPPKKDVISPMRLVTGSRRRQSRVWLGIALYMLGDLDEAGRVFFRWPRRAEVSRGPHHDGLRQHRRFAAGAYIPRPARRGAARGSPRLRPRPRWAGSSGTRVYAVWPLPASPPANGRGEAGVRGGLAAHHSPARRRHQGPYPDGRGRSGVR